MQTQFLLRQSSRHAVLSARLRPWPHARSVPHCWCHLDGLSSASRLRCDTRLCRRCLHDLNVQVSPSNLVQSRSSLLLSGNVYNEFPFLSPISFTATSSIDLVAIPGLARSCAGRGMRRSTRRNGIAAGWPTEAMLSMLTSILNQTTITL